MRYFEHLKASGPHRGEIHADMMMYAWLLFANLGLWCQFFKSSRIFTLLHSFFMSIAVVLTLIAGFQAIVTFGLNCDMPKLHIVLGVTIIVFVVLVALGGVTSYILRNVTKVKTSTVALTNKIHRILGWILLIMAWVQLLYVHRGVKFVLILIIGLLSFGLFLLCKFVLKNNMQQQVLTQDMEQKTFGKLRQIRNSNDLSLYNGDYFIFANKVYDVNNVLASHPGGWQIAKSIRGRQVDRYLYGTQAIQTSLQQITINNHYAQSINLAGPPIAQLFNISPYPNLQQRNISNIGQLIKPCKNTKMHAVYLLSKQNLFQYAGYTQLSQLGKYWTIGLQQKIIRLYSIVNYLNPYNLQLMQKLANRIFWQNNKIIHYNGQVRQILMKQRLQKQAYIPLFIKKYQKGKFTNKLLSGTYIDQIMISKPMGRGLALHQIQSGLVLLLAAGTGLNPYCDLIDLLFKQTLILQSNQLSNQIIQQNPILKNRPFTNYQFVLYITVQQISQIHPIILYQINYLIQRNRIKAFIISKDQNSNIYAQYPALNRIKGRIQNVIKQWLGLGEQIQRIYVCGTPQFSSVLVKQFINMNISPSKYRIL